MNFNATKECDGASVEQVDADWGCVVFSVEKKWTLDGVDGMQYQWTDTRRPIRSNVCRHSGGGSIMVWAGFSGVTKTKLKYLVGSASSAKYISALRSHLQPMIDPETQVFQQDNASCHTSRETKEWFASRNIKVVSWPAYSPDLSPVKNVWGIVTQHVYAGGKQYDNLHDLQVAV